MREETAKPMVGVVPLQWWAIRASLRVSTVRTTALPLEFTIDVPAGRPMTWPFWPAMGQEELNTL